MVTVLFIVLVVIIIGLIGLVGWQACCLSDREDVREGRMLSLQSQHNAQMGQFIRMSAEESDRRERGLRSEIQSLTEALGRSKEYVQVVYPRDLDQPLEKSSGWYDRKPEIKSIKVGL